MSRPPFALARCPDCKQHRDTPVHYYACLRGEDTVTYFNDYQAYRRTDVPHPPIVRPSVLNVPPLTQSVSERRADALRKARQVLADAGVKAEITLKGPVWKPGDVVVVRHNGPGSTPFTYVRGAKSWPGEFTAGLTDAEMDTLYAAAKAQPVLQDGGKPFSVTRLA